MTIALGSLPSRARPKVPKGWLEGVIGVVALIGIWQFMTSVVFTGRHVVPSPWLVMSTMVDDRFYYSSLLTTLSEAGRGWLIGNGAAVVLAGVALLVPRVSKPLQQLGAITYCVPTVAVGPLILIFISPDAAKVAIAALSVFFVSLIAWMTGLRAADQTWLDVVRSNGGSRVTELVRVRVRAALPSAGAGLALSAPAAILGAIIGEYLGGTNGLGVVMVSAEESFQVARTWSIGIEATLVSGLAYAVIAYVMRHLAGGPTTGTAMASPPPARSRRRGVNVASQLLSPVGALASVIIVWAIGIKLLNLSPYLAKSPAAVWSFLMTGPTAASNRSTVFSALGVTLRDAGLGWLLGTVTALAGAAALVQLRRARAVVMPMVMVLRSVPLIAMTPLIALVFGQGLIGVMVVAAIVTFVPSLVLVIAGLEAAPPQAIELARAYNLSGLGTLIHVKARYALPSVFSAAKVAMPGAILGAVLAEWLLTGNGIGHLMAASLISSDFFTLWACVAIVSLVSLALYEVVGSLETAVARQVAE
jgi:ABC-type nitrate/sulfonate/bicarbonate transport system permease component